MKFMKKFEIGLESLIFASRWIQVPMYLGLIVGSILYSYRFLLELLHLVHGIQHISEVHLMLGILTLIDITMVANLLIIVVIGGYSTFVSSFNIDFGGDRPAWLDKMDAGTLKVKLTGALVSISGIHLLGSFINISKTDIHLIKWQIVIHVVFLFSTLLLAASDVILHWKHSGDSEKQA